MITFTYDPYCLIAKSDIFAAAARLETETQRLKDACHQGYATEYASLMLPSDADMHRAVLAMAEKKQKLLPTLFIVVGIGGSAAGARAIYEALGGLMHNPMNCYWADTVEPDFINTILSSMQEALHAQQAVIIALISKSGKTLETEVNAACFLDLLKKFHPYNYQEYVVIITDHDSPLYDFAQKESIAYLTIPKYVGGRYSAMSAAGLFPLAMLGIDIKRLSDGAQYAIQILLAEGVTTIAAIGAAILALHYKNGVRIHDTFLFSPALEYLGKWYRQLLGESIGKEYNRTGQLVNIGFMPTVSLGPADLHAVTQRVLAGPSDIFTSFVSCDSYNSTVCVGHNTSDQIRGKSLSVIMDAILQATLRAYQRADRPYVHYRLPAKDAFCIGEFMQWKMIETMYVGFLLGVNPFDQPAVEWYKKETRKILSHE